MQTTSYHPPAAYFVRSSQDLNTFYLLQADSHGALICQCKAARFRRTPCRHVRAVIAGECLTATPKRTTRTAPPSPFTTPDDGVARGERVRS